MRTPEPTNDNIGQSLLQRAGEALYGPRWQSELARDLAVSDRTMRRWVAGDGAPSPGVYLDLLRLTQERAQALDALAAELQRAAAP
jgi:hypothetical protein